MKQAENYKSKYVPHSFSDTKDSADAYWNYSQKKSQSVPFNRSSRSPDAIASYYSSSTSYKPQRSHLCSSPTYSKYTSPHSPETTHHAQNHCKSSRGKQYSSNFSSMRKTRYEDELDNNEKLKYINEESENFTEDNAEEDVDEEEDDHEEAGEFLEKDYEGQEGDDETEEEFDTSPQMHRAQRASKKDALLRQQRWRAIEQEPRRPRCQQRVPLATGHSSSSRYYHNVAEHEVPEPLSEEDFVLTSLRNPTRRSPTGYRQWSPSKNEPDRYDDASSPIQSSRRARTKPDADHPIESEHGKPRRCNRCGSLSNRKSESLPRNCCVFEDRLNFPTKGPIGDEPENLEQAFCGRCNLRYIPKDTSGTNDVPSPLYSSKSRRPRDTKSPMLYEVPDQGQIDKLANDYSRSSSRYPRKTAELYPEKMKRSLHTSHGSARISSRYAE